MVSSNLRWQPGTTILHQYIVTTKATRTLNCIRCNIYGCSPEAKALACTSMVRPHLEYAASAWDPYLAVHGQYSTGKSSAACRTLGMQGLQAQHISIWPRSPWVPALCSAGRTKSQKTNISNDTVTPKAPALTAREPRVVVCAAGCISHTWPSNGRAL